MTGFFSFFLPVYKNGFNNSKYSLCLACCFSLALYNFLSKSLTVYEVEIEQAQQLEKLRYSVEKKKIKDVLLAGQNKKYFITELDNKKFKVSKLTLPAKAQQLKIFIVLSLLFFFGTV
jgi:hypothetical protein